ncbi:MAG: T9SS type A sorting domain-containing protein [Candidatus Zixiibacteriota bacterium]
MNRYFFLTLFTLFIYYSSTSASIEPILELTFTVPGLDSSIKQLVFNDIDNDNSPEVLAYDGSNLVLYSIENNSILFNDVINQILSGQQLNYKILLADINRDSIADIVFGRYFITEVTTFRFVTTCELWVYDGAMNYERVNIPPFINEVILINTYDPHFGLTGLEADDINNDGYNELLLSFDELADESIWFEFINTVGTAYLYYSFPDSIIWQRDVAISRMRPLMNVNDTSYFAASRYYYSFSSGHAMPIASSKYIYPAIYSEFGIQKEKVLESRTVPTCNDPLTLDIYNMSSNNCIGNIDNTDKQIEIVSDLTWGYDYTCYNGLNSQSFNTSGYELLMHRIYSPDSIELVWDIELTDENYYGFLYAPNYPGFFFAIRDNSLIQFNGTDGSYFQSYDYLPTGRKFWDYPFDDGIVRLVVINNNLVSIYRLDITTDISDNLNISGLPASFTLHQPYPNPFNAELSIPITLDRNSHLKVEIYNLLGQQVDKLFDREAQPGELTLNWKAGSFSSGIYLIKASSERESASVKVVLLK